MTSTTPTESLRDSIVPAIGLLVLLIGMVTGNAIAMFAISCTALVILPLFYRDRLGSGVMIAMVVAALIGCGVAIAMMNVG